MKFKKLNHKKTFIIASILIIITIYLNLHKLWISMYAESGVKEVKQFFKRSQIENLYVDDYDFSRLVEILHELTYIERHVSIFNIRPYHFWLRRLDTASFIVRSRIDYKTGVMNNLKKPPTYISNKEYQDKIKEAQRKDRWWKAGQEVTKWNGESYLPISIAVYIREYILLDNILVPCSYEEYVKNRYRIHGEQVNRKSGMDTINEK
jgi:hypothetical protein